jgi:peptidoglycan/LPS O-acetylase OafA/YrhL
MIIPKSGMNNNFTILRLALAWLVFVGHFKILAGGHNLSFPFIYADVAVDGFFVVSGYLITSSFDSDGSLRRFFTRRLFRLYPLYLTVVLLQAVAMACVAQGSLRELLHDMLVYVLANAVFLNFLYPDVANVVAGLPVPAINPSLWTLKIEVGFYLVLPFLWMLVRRYGNWLLAAIFVLSIGYSYAMHRLGLPELAKQLPGQMQYFVLGMALYRYRDDIPAASTLTSRLLWGAAILASFVFVSIEIRAPVIYPVAMAVVVFGVACRTWPLDVRLDLSYGIYLVHGPILQLSQVVGWYQNSAVGFFSIAVVVIGIALLAERTIERPFIAVGKRLSRRGSRAEVALAGAG